MLSSLIVVAQPASGSVWDFLPGLKIAPAGRTVSTEETERRVRAVAALLPVTRLSDLTPLDPLRLPVFAAVTPLARDLTTHMGKGLDAVSARISALMEAVERISAEAAPLGAIRRASFRELAAKSGPRPVDPTAFDLPDDSAYAPDLPFSWMAGHDLLADEPVLLPADLALNPPAEGILREVDTNGLAAGNTHLEAVVHALCEAIERDAWSQLEFLTLYADPYDPRPALPAIDLQTLPEAAGAWAERLRAHGLGVLIQSLTGDVEVATFRAVLTDPGYPTPDGPAVRHFVGWGTAPEAATAVLRALTEAVQARLGTIQGARDSFNVHLQSVRAGSRRERLRQRVPGRRISFSRIPSFRSCDLRDDLGFLLERLAAAGFRQAIAADLTRSDLGLATVRVRVPGLACFAVNRRRVGWRCLRHLL